MWALLFAIFPSVLADCPIGTTYHPEFNRCYLFVSEAQPFGLAEDACAANKGHIVSVSNGFENAMLAESASAQNIKTAYFIGANRLQGNWSNSDGSPLFYTNWAQGQPSTTATCAVASAPDGMWTSTSCSTAYPFICAIAENAHPSVTCPTCPTPTCPTPPRQPGHCESGWAYFDKTDSCYRRFVWANFENAEEVCVSNGGHLASIHSAEENTFVNDISESGMDYSDDGSLTWIGLTQANYPSSTVWTWTDGTPFDYKNWAPGEPNNSKGVEHCVQIQSDYVGKDPSKDTSYRRWNDMACSTNMRSYVCKKGALH
ncbi:unnamed protein product [Strongylus vulgaris]|uniref:C-type lectin domain-containing protein n=1 Tax=Strongylus vulgaris TaxID=40348 RepID=A0A3P7IWN4_STRVU|nr:unnamed protein product [Strongylus vulgaris]